MTQQTLIEMIASTHEDLKNENVYYFIHRWHYAGLQ